MYGNIIKGRGHDGGPSGLLPPLTSGVASENLHTVSIPPSFQWPSSLTNMDNMHTLLWLDFPYKNTTKKSRFLKCTPRWVTTGAG